MKPWVARTPTGSRATVIYYPIKSGETFSARDVVDLDANEEVLEVSGADPTPLLGLATEAAADVIGMGTSKCGVEIFDAVTIFGWDGSVAASEDHILNTYGILESSGDYIVDISDTTNLRITIVDVDTDRDYFFGRVIDAHRAIPA